MALMPPFFSDCVVAIGADGAAGARNWLGTGFLYGRLASQNESGRRYHCFLVSNRHVFEPHDRIALRFNPKAEDEAAREYEDVPLRHEGTTIWMGHPNEDIDVAAVRIDLNQLNADGMAVNVFQSDQNVVLVHELRESGVTEGDGVFVLGFPMGLVGSHRNAVTVRSGTIATIRPLLAGTETDFVIDALVFPGNSGGPVVLKPELFAIDGTKANNKASLIGIVHSYVSYREVAVSAQTREPRIVFMENSGLARVHPVDYVNNVVDAILERDGIKGDDQPS